MTGAGEGATWRFSGSFANPHIGDREMHSTLGTVLFSYGAVGFALFAVTMALISGPRLGRTSFIRCRSGRTA